MPSCIKLCIFDWNKVILVMNHKVPSTRMNLVLFTYLTRLSPSPPAE